MRCSSFRLAIFILAIGVVAFAQNPPAKEKPEARVSDARDHDKDSDRVGEDTAVLTLDGFCDPASVIGVREKPCRTVVTRSEFEELAEASGTDEDTGKVQLAAAYVRYSLLAREAQKRGLDKDPSFQKKLELSRIEILSRVLIRDLQIKSEKFSADDLQKFFRENPGQFEQATFLRIHIPDTRYVTHPNQVQDPLPKTAPEMKALAAKIYERARAGEDFLTLQKEALEASGLEEDPAIALDKMTREHLRPSHRFVFDLKPGEVSTLVHDPEEGYAIYKLVSRETPPLDSVKSQVAAALEKQRMDSWIKAIMTSASPKMSEEYFGVEGAKTFK